MQVQCKPFKFFVDAIRRVAPECHFHFTSDGIEVRAINPTTVALVLAKFKVECPIQEDIAVNTYTLKNLLTCFDDETDYVLNLSLSKSGDKQFLIIESGNISCRTELLDPRTIRKSPETNYDYTRLVLVELTGCELSQAIIRCNSISPKVEFKVENGQLFILTDDPPSMVSTRFDKCLPEPRTVKSRFSLDYMRDLAKSMSLADTVKIWVGNDFPVRFDFTYNGVDVAYLLAPRVEER